MSAGLTFRNLTTPAAIATAYGVMRQLRPHLASVEEFTTRVQRQFADGYRLLAACQGDAAGDAVLGLAGYRVQETLIRGRFCYIDDLIVDGAHRRSGIGDRLMDEVAREARLLGCPSLVLDTALENGLGQRFYFRRGMLPSALRFAITLETV